MKNRYIPDDVVKNKSNLFIKQNSEIFFSVLNLKSNQVFNLPSKTHVSPNKYQKKTEIFYPII